MDNSLEESIGESGVVLLQKEGVEIAIDRKKSRGVIITQGIIGKINSIIGYSVGGFGIIGLMLEVTENRDPFGAGLAFFFIVVGGVLVYNGLRIKNRIKRFKHYVSLISIQGITCLEGLAVNTQKSIDFVRQDLQEMINKRFFKNVSIDVPNNAIIIKGVSEQGVNPNPAYNMENFICPRCGAPGIRPVNISVICEYCGAVV